MIQYTQSYILPEPVKVGFVGVVSSQCPVGWRPIVDWCSPPIRWDHDPQIADPKVDNSPIARVLP